MNEKKDPEFTIGQFAALHGINKKTLMWYDEIGLLKPARIRDNGYRCYTYQQSGVLETILLLRDLHVSLKDIADFMENCSVDALAALLENKLAEVDAEIARLETLKTTMSRRRQEMVALSTLDLTAITLVDQAAPQPFMTVPTTAQTNLNDEIAKVLAVVRAQNLERLYDATYGAMLPVEALYDGRFDDYTALTITMPVAAEGVGWHTPPAGTYLRAYHQGDWTGLAARYRALLAFAAREGLVFQGYAYEKSLNDAVSMSIEDSITEIMIPVSVA